MKLANCISVRVNQLVETEAIVQVLINARGCLVGRVLAGIVLGRLSLSGVGLIVLDQLRQLREVQWILVTTHVAHRGDDTRRRLGVLPITVHGGSAHAVVGVGLALHLHD